jgi:hypothetical protein
MRRPYSFLITGKILNVFSIELRLLLLCNMLIVSFFQLKMLTGVSLIEKLAVCASSGTFPVTSNTGPKERKDSAQSGTLGSYVNMKMPMTS